MKKFLLLIFALWLVSPAADAQDKPKDWAQFGRYAEMNGCVYVDYHSVMKDERNGLPEKYSTDGVHPTDAGYEIMESIIKPAIENTLSGK